MEFLTSVPTGSAAAEFSSGALPGFLQNLGSVCRFYMLNLWLFSNFVSVWMTKKFLKSQDTQLLDVYDFAVPLMHFLKHS